MSQYPPSVALTKLDQLVDHLIDKFLANPKITQHFAIAPERMRAFAGNIPTRLDERMDLRGHSIVSRIWSGGGHSGMLEVIRQ